MKTALVMPLDSLAVEPGVPPSPGDTVEITGIARVESVQDGKARLVIETLNDAAPEWTEAGAEPDADDAKKKQEESDDAALTKQAEEADLDQYR